MTTTLISSVNPIIPKTVEAHYCAQTRALLGDFEVGNPARHRGGTGQQRLIRFGRLRLPVYELNESTRNRFDGVGIFAVEDIRSKAAKATNAAAAARSITNTEFIVRSCNCVNSQCYRAGHGRLRAAPR